MVRCRPINHLSNVRQQSETNGVGAVGVSLEWKVSEWFREQSLRLRDFDVTWIVADRKELPARRKIDSGRLIVAVLVDEPAVGEPVPAG